MSTITEGKLKHFVLFSKYFTSRSLIGTTLNEGHRLNLVFIQSHDHDVLIPSSDLIIFGLRIIVL